MALARIMAILGISTTVIHRLVILLVVLHCALLQFSTVICDEVQESSEEQLVDNATASASAGESIGEKISIEEAPSLETQGDGSHSDEHSPSDEKKSEDGTASKESEEGQASAEEEKASEEARGEEAPATEEVTSSEALDTAVESPEEASADATAAPEGDASASTEDPSVEDPRQSEPSEEAEEQPEESQPAEQSEEATGEEASSEDQPKGEESASTEQAESVETQEEATPSEQETAAVDESEEVPAPDPRPQIGEPAFVHYTEPENEDDIQRDRSLLDNFANSEESEVFAAAAEKALKELKKVYDSAIKPLETVYEYNSLTTRVFGDSEIHAKPMILVLGPTGTGKTTAVKYLLGMESSSIPRIPVGTAPARSLFTIWRWGDEPSVESGPELAADWVFASMQRYGTGAYEQLVGIKVPAPLLKKVTIVDCPAILESIGHIEEKRKIPRNDVYQWMIDRADLILFVFDPYKPDMGLEMEALLDQLKGREAQTRILMNKADTASPNELTIATADLLWNLSPLLGGNRAPQVYAVSLRQRAYKPGGSIKLISLQEAALYKDIVDIVVNRVSHKVAAARRHAIRVRNHSKLVNLYLKAYTNAKGLFSNKKKVASQIVEDPFRHRIYQEVSFAKNVSRYDLPDPEIYMEFFKHHKLYDFKKFEDLCTYFKGCPQDKLDICIAYDLSEIVLKYKKELGSTSVDVGIEVETSEGDMPAVAA